MSRAVLYISLVFDMLDIVCDGKKVFRCVVFVSLFFFVAEMNRQLIFSVDEELAVPRTIAFVCWNCLASCRLESGVHMNIPL